MEASSAKEGILKNIRKALTQRADQPFPAIDKTEFSFAPTNEDLAVMFAEKFTSLQGKFSLCESEEELVVKISQLVDERSWNDVYCVDENIKSALASFGFNQFTEKQLVDSDVAITKCELLVARTGSMVLSTSESSGRTTSVYAPIHICIAKTSQLVYDVKDALAILQKKYGAQLPSSISFATGPSRTADIEKTLVVGVHGPKEVFCFLLDK
ncbi:MAG: lactate utilization protein C [bacterium]|jgi:L-lactate dehydrogenase complex protein LldG